MDKEAIEKITTLLRSEIQLGKHQMTAGDVIAKKIDAIYKSLGYVQLDKDQDLPGCPYHAPELIAYGTYLRAQKTMLDAGFKKVKE